MHFLAVTPPDGAGYTCLTVIVVFYIKYVWVTPATDYNTHIRLTEWTGIRRVNSLVNGHESNGGGVVISRFCDTYGH